MNSNDINMASSGLETSTAGTTQFESVLVADVGKGMDTMVLNTDLAERDESLDKFFERPVIIANFAWDAASSPTLYRPWAKWAEDKAVARKLANYAYFSGNLHLRFEIIGTPYHYGLLLGSYVPNPFPLDTFDTSVYASAPYAYETTHVEMEPNAASAYELTIPYFYESRKLSMARNGFFHLGVLYLNPHVQLRLSNAAVPTAVNVRVYAWATDVVLEGPTVSTIIYTQSAVRRASHKQSGKVTKPPKLTTKATSLLDTAYDIGKTVIGWAEWLGFSRPPVETKYALYASRKFDICNIEGEDNVTTLGQTSKTQRPLFFPSNGVDTIDPMSISELCGREGLLTTTAIDWSPSTPIGTELFVLPVLPGMISLSGTSAAGQVVYMPPISYFSQRFSYWRGTIIYRIKIIASKQHSGRLRIYYDPVGAHNSFTVAPDDPQNVTRTYMLDLSEENSYEFEIGWCSDKPFLPIPYYEAATSKSKYLDINNATKQFCPIANGFLTIEAASNLSSPLSSQPVKILVFARAGDDFEVMRPSDVDIFSLGIAKLSNPGSVEIQSSALVVNPLEDVSLERASQKQSGIFKKEYQKANRIVLVKPQPTGSYADELSGERIVSWRPLLKRPQLEYTSAITSTSYVVTPNAIDYVVWEAAKYPRCSHPYSTPTTDSNYCVKMVNMTLLGICFTAQRGGVKDRVYVPPSLGKAQLVKYVLRSSSTSATGFVPYSGFLRAIHVAGGAQLAAYFTGLGRNTGDSLIDDPTEPNGVVFPDISNRLFEPSSLLPSYKSGRSFTTKRVHEMWIPNDVDGDAAMPAIFTSAADDYEVIGYRSTPKMQLAVTFDPAIYVKYL